MKQIYFMLTPAIMAFMQPMCASAQVASDAQSGITRVFEYRPAPGQFINTMPEFESGDTQESINQKAQELLTTGGTITLGAYGGYVVMGFDHMVENRPGVYDFQVLGNAFNASGSQQGGSSEPGVVYVSYDANGNGLPDDKWYQLAGSEYGKSQTLQNYTVTYHRTPADHVPTPTPGTSIIDNTYIRWTDSEGGEGYLEKNAFNTQNYWPMWQEGEETITFTGVRLAPNTVDRSGEGKDYFQTAYPWGYADNKHNGDKHSKLDIQWAVDAEGNRVNLPGIHFVKVQTAVLQSNGWIGESSTDVSGAVDLHMTGGDEAVKDSKLMVLTFEDEDYQGEAANYWSSLVDDVQYGGKLLYGESGSGFTSQKDAYKWYDLNRTYLTSMLNNSYGSWAYWNGGIAVSDYVTDKLEGIDFHQQLALYRQDAQTAQGQAGNQGSARFAVINGADNTAVKGTDSRAVLRFDSGRTGIIDHAYVSPTALFLSSIVHGTSFCPAASKDTYVDFVAEGYDVQGNLTGKVTLRLVDGLHHQNVWAYMDLSALGRVNSVKFDFQASKDQCGEYGINVPAYIAIDDIAVHSVEETTGISDVPSQQQSSDDRMYDISGRQIRQAAKGQIIVKGGKKVIF